MKHFHNAKYPCASFNLVFLQPNHGNHSSFASSRMACKWNHAVCSLLSLTSFTKYNECEFCSCCCILISFYCWVVFYYVDVPQFVPASVTKHLGFQFKQLWIRLLQICMYGFWCEHNIFISFSQIPSTAI